MSIIRNVKDQINSFNNDVDIINTKHQQWEESYKALQEEIRGHRELEKEAADIQQIMEELRMAVMPRSEVHVQQYVRRDEPVWSKGFNNSLGRQLKQLIKR